MGIDLVGKCANIKLLRNMICVNHIHLVGRSNTDFLMNCQSIWKKWLYLL